MIRNIKLLRNCFFPILHPNLGQPVTTQACSSSVCSQTPQPRSQTPSLVNSPWPSIIHHSHPSSITNYIFDTLQDYATMPAIVSGDNSLTYLETWSSSLRFGSSLLDLGVLPGQVLAAVLPNKAELPIVTLGATEVGVTVAHMCPSSPTESICRQLVSSCASAVITTSDLLPKVNKAARYYGKLKTVIVVDDGIDREELELNHEQVDFREMLAKDVVTWPTQDELSKFYNHHPAILTWCRGSYHAAFSHKNVIAGLEQMRQLWDSVCCHVVGHTTYQITTLVTASAIRTSGLAAIMLHLKLGHRVVIDRKCPTLPAAMDLYQPSVNHLGPVAAQWIANNSFMSKHLTSLRYLAIHPTVAPLNSALIENLAKHCGPNTLITQHHSRPELFSASHVKFQNNSDLKLPGLHVPFEMGKTVGSSCGLPLSDTQCKVVGPDGATLPTHSVGKLCVRGPQVMDGVWDKGVVRRNRDQLLDIEGWLVTEDSAYCDGDGNTFLVNVHPYNGKISFTS